MVSLYYTLQPIDSYDFLLRVLTEFYGVVDPLFSRSVHGKPSAACAPFFSLSHTKGLTAVAVCDREIGLDCEKVRPFTPFSGILASLTEEERREIGDDAERFFRHWTIKESYIKYLGDTVAGMRNLTFVGERLYEKGNPLFVAVQSGRLEDGSVYSICTEREESKLAVHRLTIKEDDE